MHYELEGRYESFTLGKEVSVAQVEEISAICARHGFELAGFRSFEKALTDDQIARAWENARRTMQAASRP